MLIRLIHSLVFFFSFSVNQSHELTIRLSITLIKVTWIVKAILIVGSQILRTPYVTFGIIVKKNFILNHLNCICTAPSMDFWSMAEMLWHAFMSSYHQHFPFPFSSTFSLQVLTIIVIHLIATCSSYIGL